MKVPFTWKVTGWFMIGWSAEFSASEVRPLRYFGEDLVAYRDESGELHVLSGHCKHLGAHIGHGGKVVGDCVECPFHGWRWGPDGTNRYIPYQPGPAQQGAAAAGLPGPEQYGCVFVWHQPDGKEPHWEMPDYLHNVPAVRHRPRRVLPAVPGVLPSCRARAGASADRRRERARQRALPLRARRHRDTGVPELGSIVDEEWRFLTGWPDARSDDPTRWRCGSTATSPGSAAPSARSRVRRTTG